MALKYLSRRLALGLLIGVALASGAVAKPLKTDRVAVATPKGPYAFKVEVADTFATREKGLMYRKELAPDRGMLFDFNPPQAVAFWMHNTLIPLDILFISPEGRVLNIARNARPMDDTPLPSAGTVRGVLEIKGGRAAELGIEPGAKVTNRIFKGD